MKLHISFLILILTEYVSVHYSLKYHFKRTFRRNSFKHQSDVDVINTFDDESITTTKTRYEYNDLVFFQDDEDKKNLYKKPLLYLPGLDGSGNYSTLSLLNLTKEYNVWRLLIRPNDRSRFIDVASVVIKFINETFDEPPVIIGER